MYKKTALWKRTLGSSDPNVDRLRKNYEQSRNNVAFLLDKIRNDFPFLTRHDITHVDSLWRVADTILGKEYPINPLEGYILGIAFLIHDLALSYDTVGGKERLRATSEWRDTYAGGCPPKMTDEEFKKECDFNAIRLRHAREAETILDTVFPIRNGKEIHILGEDDFAQFIRKHYGYSIGLIAASHHWGIGDVESRLDPEKDPVEEISLDWKVNEWKLACILRCADAGHIDNGRAPDSLYKHLVLNDVPRQHWEAQGRLSVVTEDTKDRTKLRIKSIDPFPKSAFAAWAVAYAAVRQFDEEIRKSNNLLRPLQSAFPHDGVCGASSMEALKQYIKTTSDWEPFDCSVHTSSILALIKNLGGSALYSGAPLIIVMRELIQNARDAIHARSKIRSSFSLDEGKITVKYFERDGKRFLDVSDNGIGMTLDCIKNQLLDFGSSYWKSSLCQYENPGLVSSGFSPVGKFGIGFFSVFMIAKSVVIKTKRFDRYNSEPVCVEFPHGLTLTPILSYCDLDETISTEIRLELNDNIDLEIEVSEGEEISAKLAEVLPLLVAGLDAYVYYAENTDSAPKCIHRSIISKRFSVKKWFADLIPPRIYRQWKNEDEYKEVIKNLTVLRDEGGRVRGIIAPHPLTIFEDNTRSPFSGSPVLENMPCLVTIGGLALNPLYTDLHIGKHRIEDHDYYGYLDCHSNTISRENADIDNALLTILQSWAKEQYRKHFEGLLEYEYTAHHYANLLHCLKIDKDLLIENEIRIYSGISMMAGVPLQSLRCILLINMYLLNALHLDGGPVFNRDAFRVRQRRILLEYDDKLILNALSDNTNDSESNHLQPLRECLNGFHENEKEFLFVTLKAIGMPILSSEDIIRMYLALSTGIVRAFDDIVLQVWVNLLLENHEGKMVNWEKANTKIEFKSSELNKEKEFIRFIKQFMISKNEYIDSLKAYIS